MSGPAGGGITRNDWIGVRAGRVLPGLRLVLMRGFPSPWSQAARCLYEFKELAFAKVQRLPDEPQADLVEWTGQSSLPAAVLEEERARTGWAEILLLAERLQPWPPLIPPDPSDRRINPAQGRVNPSDSGTPTSARRSPSLSFR